MDDLHTRSPAPVMTSSQNLVDVIDLEPIVELPYAIAACPAHSGKYVAENILVDNPTDQASRWSGAHQGNAKQWILLRLQPRAILKSITFGKYWKSHPCNMKEFKIFVGNSTEHMIEVLHSGLKNDSSPETFPIKYTNSAGVCFPTTFVKVVPLSAHGQNFHTSIWHVKLAGINDEGLVAQVHAAHEKHRETSVLCQILKHLRQRRLLTPFQSISIRSGLQLEHPLISQLYNSVVLHGDWLEAEELLQRIADAGLYNTYLRSLPPYASWKRLVDGDGDAPSPRGGHAMCFDPVSEVIYLFGGWDGQKNLDDFWAYEIKEGRWKLLCQNTSMDQNAPGARSCHKMVYDTKTGSVYILGRLSDADSSSSCQSAAQTLRTGSNTTYSPQNAFCSEFYRYHTRGVDAGKWDFLAFDTAASGGPPLIFDHQMVMDCDAQMLYVFGGRVVDGDWDSVKYSGLYSYSVRLSKWRLLQHSDHSPAPQSVIPARFGHSMVFVPSPRTLLVFGGQRDEKYLSDMYTYDIGTNTSTEIFSNFSSSGGPDPCFTQRAVVDSKLKEIYMFFGLTRSIHPGAATVLASETPCWLYSYENGRGKWNPILPLTAEGKSEEPLPRYAHQVAYNPKSGTVYLHGGNAGLGPDLENIPRASSDGANARAFAKENRLDDFWAMSLIRPGPKEITRRAKFKIRQQRFREMCEDGPPLKALNYLQTEVASVVDHSNLEEADTFRSLLAHLLDANSSPTLQHESESKAQRRNSDSRAIEEHWTNQLYDDENNLFKTVPPPIHQHTISTHDLKSCADPLERGFDDERPVSAERFSQRNDLFENLLHCVDGDAKQPPGNLMDMIEEDLGV